MRAGRASKPRLYPWLFDKVLTRTDPEKAHHAATSGMRLARPLLAPWTPRKAVKQVMGVDFRGVVGLAAGFDKNGEFIDALGGMGFGFIEIGTVTAKPQPGNPRPRLFRLPDDRAIVNRMGFNNDGAESVRMRLMARPQPRRLRVPLGINIGKTKVVPEDDEAAVIADYEKSAGLLAPLADYLVVNVSSPNTPGLRNLQAVERLQPILEAVRRRAAEVTSKRVPLLVKIAPDLADQDVLAVADMAVAIGLDGIVATNTTISRDGLQTPAAEVEAIGAGGLSGAPLRARANEVVALLRKRVGSDMALIGVGGISTEEDVRERLDAGADLLQVYTGFIYGGPFFPRRMNRAAAHHEWKAGRL